jgi:signal transduction histidine kinase/CheY-like chemotaxis protein
MSLISCVWLFLITTFPTLADKSTAAEPSAVAGAVTLSLATIVVELTIRRCSGSRSLFWASFGVSVTMGVLFAIQILLNSFAFLEFVPPSGVVLVSFLCNPETTGPSLIAIITFFLVLLLANDEVTGENLHRLFVHVTMMSITYFTLNRLRTAYEAACAELHRACEAEARFIAVCSHELRTPLNAILSYCSFLDDGDASDTDEDEADVAARRVADTASLRSAAESLHQIVENVLAFSSSTSQVRLQPLSAMAEALAGLRSMMRARSNVHQTPITIKWTLDPELSQHRIALDRFRLVLLNLMTNAIKFSPEGSEVTVSCVVRWADTASGDGEASGGARCRVLETSVTDKGPGLTVPESARVFVPFVRLSNSTGVEGVGLGLSICQASVERCGGTIVVDSSYRGGARFIFTLPLSEPSGDDDSVAVDAGSSIVLPATPQQPTLAPAAPKPAPVSVRAPSKHRRILIVDDVAVNRKLLARHLTRVEPTLELVEADGGVAVLDRSDLPDFDFIFVDLFMPTISGIELVHILRLRHPGVLGSIIASSASRVAWSILEQAGFDGCIPKPVPRDALADLLAHGVKAVKPKHE